MQAALSLQKYWRHIGGEKDLAAPVKCRRKKGAKITILRDGFREELSTPMAGASLFMTLKAFLDSSS
ncbi:hypothetical protein NPIL_123161 [Nephila pilipes]|uniref:Uncharacterized protein n=1 Tax=Nephila pilipes TaxID=299642 RepID=A0A8X6KF48_NEPPI|nr:hypothetical protein NPIL_123161 [Nephila pilipes]